ncbi:mannose-specific lectin-like [Dioscorea cayenensis subsp. rotundata]|uniref:Mannose-specific lectin-like n=1 Tax=Dioscorea cayennensis subsp. rotundata TaxID=55577 RepID=A0AB40AT57_DIOCR|nr:mannose-specific lectin-like [Dioscorea cayenensis subsp. rotundata]
MAGNILYGSNSLGPGQSLAYGSFKLVMQEDCNLNNNEPKPCGLPTKAGGQGNYVFILQKDRNLAVYGPVTWQTKTSLAGSDGLLIDSNDTIFGALPANKNTEEAKATRISMVVNK